MIIQFLGAGVLSFLCMHYSFTEGLRSASVAAGVGCPVITSYSTVTAYNQYLYSPVVSRITPRTDEAQTQPETCNHLTSYDGFQGELRSTRRIPPCNHPASYAWFQVRAKTGSIRLSCNHPTSYAWFQGCLCKTLDCNGFWKKSV